MPVPTQCKPIADEIEKLQAEREDVKGLAGAEKWAALQRNASIAAQIAKKRAQLDQCVLQNAPGYETEVIIYDLAGSTAAPVAGRMWTITPPASAAVIEAHPVQGGRISFVHGGSIGGSSIGISIHDGPNPTFSGPMFRSGPSAALPHGSPADPAGLIEIGVPAAVSIPDSVISASLPAPSSIVVGGGITVTSLALTPGSGRATLAIGASATVGLGFLGTIVLPFTYRLAFTISPSFNMNDVTEVCVVAASGPATLATPLGGLVNFILTALTPAFEPMITGVVVPIIQGALNRVILSTAAGALNVPVLPTGVVLSLRRVVISPGGVALFAAVGAYGGLLNKITLP